MAAVKKGVGREIAHEVIKKHAIASALNMREGKPQDLISRLASEKVLNLTEAELNSLLTGFTIKKTSKAHVPRSYSAMKKKVQTCITLVGIATVKT
jgi:adenylosuccinate lyase